MDEQVFTHAMWRVAPGQEEAFIAAWSELAATFSTLERPPVEGWLIRNEEDPSLFYSFGPWRSADDVRAMRSDPAAQQAMERVRRLCEQATPGLYRLVRHVKL